MRAYATPPCAGCADAHDFGAVRISRIQFRMASPGHELLIHELLNVINASSALNSMLRTLIARSSAPILLFSAIDPQARPSWKPCILSTQASCCTAHAIMLHRTITTAAPSPPYLGAVDDPRRRPIFRVRDEMAAFREGFPPRRKRDIPKKMANQPAMEE